MPLLSAIVITRNEAANIAECLDSLAFCDERIVVDCGSTDDTVEIAGAKGANVSYHAWEGFGPQKNHALSLAAGDWVLSLDADERVSPQLAAAIKNAIERGRADGYEFPRRSSFCGRPLRYSGWHPDYVLRLFRRGRGRFTDVIVHERVVCDGPVARLAEPLLHHPVIKLEDALSRIDRYSTASAQAIVASGRRVSFMTGIGHGIGSFLRAYVLRLGFLDGAEGFLLAVANAEGSYYRYMKAWLEGGAVAELISVIVATYNREDALDAVLRGLSRQADRRFEVLVADDGSGPATAQVIAAWAARGAFPLAHVRHEDRGFRLAEIRNRAILESKGSLCIFLDGDCIPRPDFVAAHRRLAAPGWFVAGNRVLLGQALTARVLREHLEPELWGLREWMRHRLHGEVNRLAPLAALPLGPLRRLGPAAWRSARGTNLAIARGDLARVDGFDATFNGWGREDSDIMVRLIRAGVRRKDGRYATAVLHLWHPEFDRSRLAENERMLADVIDSDRVRAVRGLSVLAA